MNALKKFQNQVAKDFEAKKSKLNEKIQEQKDKRNKAIADSVSDAVSGKSGKSGNPYDQEGQVTFSLHKMHDFTHEELQTVILRYDSKYKETKGVLAEKTDLAEKLEAAL